MTRFAVTSLIIALAVFLPACHRDPAPESPSFPLPYEVSLSERDEVFAIIYPLPQPDGSEEEPVAHRASPAVVFLDVTPMAPGRWDYVARTGRQRGFWVAAPDLGGMGDDKEAVRAIKATIDAIIEAGASENDLAVVAIGKAASLAAQVSFEVPGVQAVALVSPGPRYENLSLDEALTRAPARPMLLMASKDDWASCQLSHRLHERSQAMVEFRIYPGHARGLNLLNSAATAVPQIYLWLAPILGAEAL